MDAVLLAAASAFLFGLMTVLLRFSLRAPAPPEVGALFVLLPALPITFVAAIAHGSFDLPAAWPFLLAGLVAPACSQVLFTYAIREAGPSRASVTVGTAPLIAVAIALVFLDEPLVAGLVVGAVLIVAGGIVLLSDPDRPEHVRLLGIALAGLATLAFATRDSLIRWLGTEATEVDPGVAAFATTLSATAAIAVFTAVRRARPSMAAARAYLAPSLCYGLSYICVFEAFFRGRVSVVSPIVATESLWAVALSALLLRKHELVGLRLWLGAVLVVTGGVLIGVFR